MLAARSRSSRPPARPPRFASCLIFHSDFRCTTRNAVVVRSTPVWLRSCCVRESEYSSSARRVENTCDVRPVAYSYISMVWDDQRRRHVLSTTNPNPGMYTAVCILLYCHIHTEYFVSCGIRTSRHRRELLGNTPHRSASQRDSSRFSLSQNRTLSIYCCSSATHLRSGVPRLLLVLERRCSLSCSTSSGATSCARGCAQQ